MTVSRFTENKECTTVLVNQYLKEFMCRVTQIMSLTNTFEKMENSCRENYVCEHDGLFYKPIGVHAFYIVVVESGYIEIKRSQSCDT